MTSAGIMNNNSATLRGRKYQTSNTVSSGRYTRDILFSPKECSAICKAARQFDQLHVLGKLFESVSSTICQKNQDNISSIAEATMVIQSLVQNGHVTLEYGSLNTEKDREDFTAQHDHVDNQSTEDKDFISLSESDTNEDKNNSQNVMVEESHSSESGTTLVWKCALNDNVERKNRPHACTDCGETFTEEDILRKHRLIHSDLRLYECKECGKTFTQKRILCKHNLVDSNLRPYECEMCGKTFKDRRGLRKHSSIHLGLRPYECKDCGKTFVRMDHLRQHNLVHSNLRPYECEVCGKTCSTAGNLRRHRLIHLGLSPYECKDYGKLSQVRAIFWSTD
ncbi:zinc finger protein 154-like isoform X2 [Ptychodera flava]|uniref:zinc finger protein 154-like isoform X2 n=1 Tax=Ptychodera flava TaxID=63121 RepID=UPI00396A509C